LCNVKPEISLQVCCSSSLETPPNHCHHPTITKALLASVEHKIVLINGVRTVRKLHLLFKPMASVDRGQMAGFRGGAHSVEMEVDVDEL